MSGGDAASAARTDPSDRRASELSTGSSGASEDTGEVPDFIKHGATLFVDGDPNQAVLVKCVDEPAPHLSVVAISRLYLHAQ